MQSFGQSQLGSSPYSYFGIGDIFTSGFAANSSMGDVKYAYSDISQLNISNPASYSRLRYTTFNVGLFGQKVITKGPTLSQTNDNAGFRYLALGFSPSKRIGASLGVLPFSQMKYTISDPKTTDLGTVDNRYKGEGGLNRLYAGISYMAIQDSSQTLSFGINGSFYFGTINRVAQNEIPVGANGYHSEHRFAYNVTDAGFDVGVLYRKDVSKYLSKKESQKKYLNIGLTFTPSTSFQTDFKELGASYTYVSTTRQLYRDTSKLVEKTTSIDMPFSLGTGIGLDLYNENTKRKWSLYLDYGYSNWSQLKIDKSSQGLNDESQVSFGAQLIPNTMNIQKFFDYLRYRVGARYKLSRLKLAGEQLTEYGISFGIGVPIKTNFSTTSSFNLAFEYGQRGKVKTGLIQENFTNITIGLTLTPSKWDQWFKKRKID